MSDWKSESIDQLVPALLKAQMAMEPAVKDHKNPAFKSKYADLNGCLEAVNAALHPNGLVISQLPMPSAECKGFVLKTVLLHTSGQWLASDLPMDPDMTNPQKVGGCVTYARRYGLAAVCGLTQEDDDGETANGRGAGHDYDRHPANGNGYDRRPANGNGYDRRPANRNGYDRRPDPPHTAPSGDGGGRTPATGKALYAWAKEQGDRSGSDVVGWLNKWGQRENLPPKMVEWDAETVGIAVTWVLGRLQKTAATN